MNAGTSLLAFTAQPLCPLPPAKLAEAIALSHWRTGLYFAGTAWIVLALWLLVRLRVGAAIARLAERVSTNAWLQGLIAIPLWGLLYSAITIPVAMLGHHVALRFGLSIERWPAWWLDWLKSSAITLAFGIVALSILYGIMRRSPRRWWIWFWAITIPLEVVATWAAPLVIDPLFNHFTPLAQSNPALVEQLERVAARGGLNIPPSRIFLMDASTRVTGANAYVTGLGASKRIVVWDTTLKIETPNEILFTYGHEQGHYVLEHIQKGLLFFAAMMLVGFWLAYWLMNWLVRQYGEAWGIRAVEDWASLGLLLLVMTVLGFVAEPIGNAFSRWEEHAADVYGQEVIHGLVPDAQGATVRSFQRLGEMWLDVPDPNPLVVFWTYSHPPTAAREEFAAGYDPWANGERPRYVR